MTFLSGNDFFSLSLFVALIITYLWCLFEVFRDPYFIDNGTYEEMIFPEHLFWAVIHASIRQFVTVPVLVGLFYLSRFCWIRLRKQK